jgi:Uma2 family endonuclease
MSALIQRRRFTVADYHRMGDAGILLEDDRVELIYGEIVTMSPIGNPHNAAVDRANRALVRAAGDQAIVRVQGSVVLDDYDEPQPDVVLLKPRDDFYRSQAAGPDDIILIVEMADSSLAYDRELKAHLYAETGVNEYWVVDIKGEQVFAHSGAVKKRYRTVRELHRGESAAPQLLPGCRIAINDLLP